MITAESVKKLRETTGAGMMDCKKALAEVNGDFEAAIDYLRTKGLAAAAKKQGRIAADGLVGTFVNNKMGVVVEVNCETDFVAKNTDFQELLSTVADQVFNYTPVSVDDLLTTKLTNGMTLADKVSELTLKIGEKIAVRRFATLPIAGTNTNGTYVHGGKIGVLVNFTTTKADTITNPTFQEYMKDVCMHVTAADPKFVVASEIDEDFKKREADIYTAQLKEQGKPENMIGKIVEGKLQKLATDVCLVEQKFVKDPDITVKDLTKKVSETLGDTITINKFIKFTLGEGIEKKEDNFAEEVAKMMNN